ncbi:MULTISPECIES: hypothetical protein [Geobacter]|uniref:Uncharacterized protein n=2 Tax=Geobacter TaxID=28231 RepID=A0A0C1QVP2_9BACT|nr:MULTISPECIES: hypothetical protein [Geobacter]KIE42231.1 hypothetical protein SE37_06155 [Geobacter soli]MBE2887230.1 hypothetical protein [Geobacter anodireducens]
MNADKIKAEELPTIDSCMIEFHSLAQELERASAAVWVLQTLLWHEEKRVGDEQLLFNGVMELLSVLGSKLNGLKESAQEMIPEDFFQASRNGRENPHP